LIKIDGWMGGGAKKTFKMEKVITKDSEKFKNSSDTSYL
jgi:hypothetical protein